MGLVERTYLDIGALEGLFSGGAGSDFVRLLFERAPSAIAVFDRDMRYLAASRRWYEDYELGDQQILGRCHYDVFPDVPHRWKAEHAKCLAGETLLCDEDHLERSDGSVVGGLRPDLLLADVVLPRGMSGKDVSEAVAARVPSCRILFMSGYTEDAVMHHGRLDEGVVLLSKPFPRELLASKVRELLDG